MARTPRPLFLAPTAVRRRAEAAAMPINERTLRVMASHVGFDSLTALAEAAQVGRGTIRRGLRGEGVPESAIRSLAWQLERPSAAVEACFAVREPPAPGDDDADDPSEPMATMHFTNMS